MPSYLILVASDCIYRLLLRAYPANFRRDYGRDMEQCFRDACRDACRRHGVLGVVGLWISTLFDLANTAVSEHISEVTHMSPENIVHQWSEGSVRERLKGHISILEADGYINGHGGEAILGVCEQLIKKERQHFVLNMEKLRLVNSLGISKLQETLAMVRKLGGKVAFCGVSPTITKTFGIMGLLDTADIFDAEDQAVTSMEGK